MISRTCLLVALLVSPAWSQAPVADAPVLTPGLTARSFDLSNDSIKKIVREGAATQFAHVQVSREAMVESEPVATIKFVPPEKAAPAPKPLVPRLQPAQRSGGFLSAVFEILLDEALGGGSDYPAAAYSEKWLRCEGRESLETTVLGYDTCPNKNRDQLVPIGDPPTNWPPPTP